MSVLIEIQPHSASLDMYGTPDKSTAYSLSGDIVISVSSPLSLFERRKPTRIVLQSLSVEFEGQCELITEDTGYTPFRVCSLSDELLAGQTIELSNEGHEENDKLCAWSVAYNLVVPGWLPPSALYGDHRSEAGTRYALYASAKFLTVDDDANRSWFSTCCLPFRSRSRVVSAPRCEVCINRYVTVSAEETGSTIDYSVQAEPRNGTDPAPKFPSHVMSKLRTVISVPTHIDVEDSSFPICMRLRMQDLPEADCKRVRLTDFTVDVEQTEQCRTSPSSLYKSLFPLPPSSEQPPCTPLRDPHPAQTLYDVGLAVIPAPHQSLTNTISLLPKDSCGQYALSGNSYVFNDDAAPANSTTWFSVRTHVPVDSTRRRSKTGALRLRETGVSPLFSVSHCLYVKLTCTYDLSERGDGEPERATELLQFTVPLRFARVQRSPPSPPLASSTLSYLTGHPQALAMDGARVQGSLAAACFPMASLPYAHSLPPYSQLFDANGDRKIDYSVPLPAYSPPTSTDPGSCPSPAASVTSLDLLLPTGSSSVIGHPNAPEAVLPDYSAV
ncbi:hypothetical protein DAEQUDRAFT_726061 [Daedalea quercina L-15889]|uniref:Arrestin-like N-terminal domain-containing protein n=1 Tax=Daedalea quercina L-15889 TaxID=1314783 RepID=A0A165QPM6_9APHY|nr:hypothetical protein DAEQUDRAFT_726061 [Daedalea quercina L-15889]